MATKVVVAAAAPGPAAILPPGVAPAAKDADFPTAGAVGVGAGAVGPGPATISQQAVAPAAPDAASHTAGVAAAAARVGAARTAVNASKLAAAAVNEGEACCGISSNSFAKCKGSGNGSGGGRCWRWTRRAAWAVGPGHSFPHCLFMFISAPEHTRRVLFPELSRERV